MSAASGARKASGSSLTPAMATESQADLARTSSGQPRVSTSSNRSRPTADDFEAALRDPGKTLFLSSTPQAVVSALPGVGASPDTTPHAGFEATMQPVPELNADRPEPVPKRSFEEDLRDLGGPARRPSVPGLQYTPQKSGAVPGFPGIIPPTPSTADTFIRRESVATTGSTGSSPATNRTQRYRGQAVGIEDEVANMSKSVKKRRSLFRSAGTASTSDLGKASRATAAPPPLPSIPSSSTQRSGLGHMRQNSVSGRSGAAEENSLRSSSSRTAAWAGSQSDLHDHKRQGSDDGFKTMRSKAKGMFGRMFGSSKESSSSSRSPQGSPSLSGPPHLAPPISSGTVRGAPSSDVFGTLTPSRSGGSPRTPSDAAFANLSISDGRRSVTPTTSARTPVPSGLGVAGQLGEGDRLRTVSAQSGASTGSDKPLPPIRPEEQAEEHDPADPAATLGRTTLHTRQPAFTISDLDGEERPGGERARIPSFSEDVGDALASIGHEPLAQGLGLPPEAVRLEEPVPRSAAIPVKDTATIRRLPSDLSRSSSRGVNPSPVPAQRSSSLPSQSFTDVESPSPSHEVSAETPPIGSHSPVPSPQPGSAMDPMNDFGPPLAAAAATGTDPGATLRAKHDTIRLVPSPVMGSSSNILDLSDEYPSVAAVARSNSRPVMARATSAVSAASATDDGEDDEEKGRRLACEFLEGNYEHVPSDKVAMFLGGPRPVNSAALRYYMQYFDMKGQNLVESFRDLCGRLHLKAESQEIDRIIEGFSARYYECNPNTTFGSPGVLHTVTGAMLMLNTDLHVADLSKHMSRADFIRNAMRAIQESMPDASSASEILREDPGVLDSEASLGTLSTSGQVPAPTHPPAHRSASAPVVGHPAPVARMASEAGLGLDAKSRRSSTNLGNMYSRTWESETESALKDIYSAVRSERILLPTASADQSYRQSTTSLASSNDRNRSMRTPSDRINALKRGSVRMSNYQHDNNPYGAHFASSNGRLSPTPSYATSINDPMHASLGFASNLSHAVIREHEDETRSIHSVSSTSSLDEMNDDELALLGAPWAKEGILHHRLFLDAAGKRAKKLEWKQYFSVVSLGQLYMFVFGQGGGSFSMGGGAVGGGNWLQNAKPTGTVDLMHSLASPAPRSSHMVDKPHCFALTASSGSVTLFQAGTDDLVAEWVATCNYWAARRSRQPLTGGVSNMEYGWQKVQQGGGAGSSGGGRRDEDDLASIRSGRSNMSKLGGGGGGYGRKTLMPSDRMHINDWRPPPPAVVPSPLDEEAQLETLQVYVQGLRRELAEHCALEEPMIRLYASGSKNGAKAKENFKAKSNYLSGEIAKYDTYVDSLRSAIALRLKKAGERRLERSLMRSAASLHRRESDEPAHKATLGPSGSKSGTNAYYDEDVEVEDEEDALEMIRERDVQVDPEENLASDLGQGGTIRASSKPR